MKRLLLTAILTVVLPSLGCVGYHRNYDSSYSPGCYSCSYTREHGDERRSRHSDHDRGGHHHHHRDDDHDGHHRRH